MPLCQIKVTKNFKKKDGNLHDINKDLKDKISVYLA